MKHTMKNNMIIFNTICPADNTPTPAATEYTMPDNARLWANSPNINKKNFPASACNPEVINCITSNCIVVMPSYANSLI